MNPRQSRGIFICVQSPILLACASRRASTICQSRKFNYLLPVNRFRNSSLSVLLLPCPRSVDIGCSPPSSLHSSTPYPHKYPRRQNSRFRHLYFRSEYISQIIRLLFPSVSTSNWTHPLSPVFPPADALVGAYLFFISNFTAFANFLLSLVFFLYRISFCDSFGKIRYGSCYSSLYTLKGRLSVILFTSFIDLPLLFIVQLADRTFLLMQRGFSVCNIFTRLLLNLSPSVWVSAYKRRATAELKPHNAQGFQYIFTGIFQPNSILWYSSVYVKQGESLWYHALWAQCYGRKLLLHSKNRMYLSV